MRALILAILVVGAAYTQPADPWKDLAFLSGDWIGIGSGGQGDFSFQPDLNRKILIRRNAAHYDSGQQHNDLMVLYFDSPGAPRAIYFDSEGHVIRYAVRTPEPNRAVFESDSSAPGPRYRLTYWMEGKELRGSFEIAPPGAGFQPYLSWSSKKK